MKAVVIGNLVKVFGPMEDREAAKFARRFDIMSEEYNPGRWENYSVSVVDLSDPKSFNPPPRKARD